MFIACRVVWMSAVIYVPALLLTTGGTLGPEWFWPVVILIGVSSTLYTVIGGDGIHFFEPPEELVRAMRGRLCRSTRDPHQS